MENKKTIKLDPAAFGYYYLLHIYKTSKQVTFSYNELSKYVETFVHALSLVHGDNFENNAGKILNSNNKNNDRAIEEFVYEIIDNFAVLSKYKNNQYFFDKNNIDEMRESYENMSSDLKDSIIIFETYMVYGAFGNKEQYTIYEKGYKRDTKQHESENEENFMA